LRRWKELKVHGDRIWRKPEVAKDCTVCFTLPAVGAQVILNMLKKRSEVHDEKESSYYLAY
jgi:hypothetical protein